MRRQRIFHLVEAGDTSGFFPQLARWHDRDRFEMTIGTIYAADPHLVGQMNELGVPVWSGGATSRRGLPGVARRLRRRLAGGADLVHTHLFEPSLLGLGVARSLGMHRVSTRHHSNYHARMNKRWHVQLDRLATHWSEIVIAVSAHTADVMIRDEGAEPARIRTVPNGVDVDRITVSGDDELRALRASLDGGEDSLRLILHPARFHPEKGHYELFDAIAALKRSDGPRVRLLLAGEGPARREYEDYVGRIGIGADVEFLGFRRDIHDLMAIADLVVFPSLAEAFGLALLEAIYVGAPVLAADVGGMPEIVSSLGCGALVPPGDAAALADSIADCLRTPPPAAGSEQVARIVAEQYSFETMMARYEQIYDELLHRAD